MICKYLLSWGLSLHFLILWCVKVFKFDEVYFFVSYLCFGVLSKKLLPKPRLKRCTTIFLSMSFIGFPHKFRSYVHLELIFVYPIFLLIFFEIRYWSHYSFWISLFKIHYWSLQLLWLNCLFLLSVQLVFASCILVLCCQGHMVL